MEDRSIDGSAGSLPPPPPPPCGPRVLQRDFSQRSSASTTAGFPEQYAAQFAPRWVAAPEVALHRAPQHPGTLSQERNSIDDLQRLCDSFINPQADERRHAAPLCTAAAASAAPTAVLVQQSDTGELTWQDQVQQAAVLAQQDYLQQQQWHVQTQLAAPAHEVAVAVAPAQMAGTPPWQRSPLVPAPLQPPQQPSPQEPYIFTAQTQHGADPFSSMQAVCEAAGSMPPAAGMQQQPSMVTPAAPLHVQLQQLPGTMQLRSELSLLFELAAGSSGGGGAAVPPACGSPAPEGHPSLLCDADSSTPPERSSSRAGPSSGGFSGGISGGISGGVGKPEPKQGKQRRGRKYTDAELEAMEKNSPARYKRIMCTRKSVAAHRQRQREHQAQQKRQQAQAARLHASAPELTENDLAERLLRLEEENRQIRAELNLMQRNARARAATPDSSAGMPGTSW